VDADSLSHDLSYEDAYETSLAPLFLARGLLDLVHVAESTGMLAALRAQSSGDALSEATGLPGVAVSSVLEALEVNDVVVREGDHFQLTAPWLVLTGDEARVPMSATLASSEVERAVIRGLGKGADYWEMSSEERLIFARAISPDPFSPGVIAGMRRGLTADPTYDVLGSGGSLLELGCGVAGRVLSMLQALPEMRAVGIELAEDLAAVAASRAEELGVSDRFEVVTSDAAGFDRPDSFDLGYWSQFFFAEASRGPALETMRRSLRSGGVAEAPLLGDPTELADDPRGQTARERAVFRVVLGSWGVPDRSAAELVAEFDAHGFVDVEAGVGPFGNWRVRGRRP
jgi:SAM-dependent methyltransferase